MTQENTQQDPRTDDDPPPFPHHAATPQSPLEAAERQYGERPAGAPDWQPDEGDFS